VLADGRWPQRRWVSARRSELLQSPVAGTEGHVMAEFVYRPQNSTIVPPSAPAPASVGSAPAASSAPVSASKIQSLSKPHEAVESRWKRPLNKNGTGASHVRTFSGAVSQQGLEFLDRHINEWLDSHPDAEVKFATLVVGDMPTATGREPAIIAQVWI